MTTATMTAMKRAAIILMAALGLASVALAQETMPKPAPEIKKLDLLVGSWALEGDVKPSAMGPGGKITENEKCDWMEGGFFLVCHVDRSEERRVGKECRSR